MDTKAKLRALLVRVSSPLLLVLVIARPCEAQLAAAPVATGPRRERGQPPEKEKDLLLPGEVSDHPTARRTTRNTVVVGLMTEIQDQIVSGNILEFGSDIVATSSITITSVNDLVIDGDGYTLNGGGGGFHGIKITDCSLSPGVTLQNLFITGYNTYDDGGAVWLDGSIATLISVIITDCMARKGAGLWLRNSASSAHSHAVVRFCTFSNLHAEKEYGAIGIKDGNTAEIYFSTFTDNYVYANDKGIVGAQNSGSIFHVAASTFLNVAGYGLYIRNTNVDSHMYSACPADSYNSGAGSLTCGGDYSNCPFGLDSDLAADLSSRSCTACPAGTYSCCGSMFGADCQSTVPTCTSVQETICQLTTSFDPTSQPTIFPTAVGTVGIAVTLTLTAPSAESVIEAAVVAALAGKLGGVDPSLPGVVRNFAVSFAARRQRRLEDTASLLRPRLLGTAMVTFEVLGTLSALGYASAGSLEDALNADLAAAVNDGSLTANLQAVCGCAVTATAVFTVPTQAYPTLTPTVLPTAPTPEPTPSPSSSPTSWPTPEPIPEPTLAPTPLPTPEPTSHPTPEPTPSPSPRPTSWPTLVPTHVPSTSNAPTTGTKYPTLIPIPAPTPAPSGTPSPNPTITKAPTPPTPSPSVMVTVAPLSSSSYACAGSAITLAWRTAVDRSCPTMNLILYSEAGSFEANIEAYPYSPGQVEYSYTWPPNDAAGYCARTGGHKVLLRCVGRGDYFTSTFTLVHTTPAPSPGLTVDPTLAPAYHPTVRGGGGGGSVFVGSAAFVALVLGCVGVAGTVVAVRSVRRDDKGPSGADNLELAPRGKGEATRIPYASLKLEARPFAHGGGGLIFKGRYRGWVIVAKQIHVNAAAAVPG